MTDKPESTSTVERLREVCVIVGQDVEADVMRFEGRPFTAQVMSEFMGCQAAAICALSSVLVAILDRLSADETRNR